MNECRIVRARIKEMAAGESTSAIPESMRQHLRQCPECRDLLRTHARLAELDVTDMFPSEADFGRMRQAVRQRIQPRPQPAARVSFWRDLDTLLRAHPAVGAILAVILMAGMFWLGRSTFPAGESPVGEEWLLQDLQHRNGAYQDIRETWDSPYLYSNVSFRPIDGGELEVGFDVTRHVSMKVSRHSPFLREILVHALLDPSAMGNRLEAMNMTDVAGDAKVREAVIYTLHHDPQLAVRLKAMDVLVSGGPTEVVREALLRTLRQDTSVQMRLYALEHLAAADADGQAIREAIFSSGQESDPAVWVRAQELRMN
jgi:hypothetical protein